MGTEITRRNVWRPDRGSRNWHCQTSSNPTGKVCVFWLAGNCRRNPCRFLHSKPAAPTAPVDRLDRSGPKRSFGSENQVTRNKADEGQNYLHRKQETCMENASMTHPCYSSSTSSEGSTNKAHHKIWSHGSGFSILARLEGHKKAVTGICLPSGSDVLFSGSSDGTVLLWNCHTGKRVGQVDMGATVGCLINEGPWVLAGISNAVKAWNTETKADLTVNFSGGQVYALAVAGGFLFAGVHDGSILVWKFNSVTCSFEMTASLRAHTGAVVSLAVGTGNKLYSGSTDNTIRVWNVDNLQCTHTLNQHSDVVMSLICWDQFLLSCSLDRTVKVWATTEGGELEVVYTHNVEHGVFSLNGMHDAKEKPILLCSCNDDTVRLYELPSFVERSRLFGSPEVRSIHIGPGGLFFIGDGKGLVCVWKMLKDTTVNVL